MRKFNAVVVAMVCALSFTFASAQTIVMEKGSLIVWAEPISPGEALQPTDPNLGSRVANWLAIIVFETSEPLTDGVFQGAIADIAEDVAGGPASDARIDVPPVGSDSGGYLFEGEGFAFYLLFAYEGNHLYAFYLLSMQNLEEAMGDLHSVAAATLDPSRNGMSVQMTEDMVDGFIADFDGAVERPMLLLPTRNEVPSNYQLIDEEFLELHPA